MVYSTRRFVVCLSMCHFVLCFLVLLVLRLPRLGKRELILLLFVRLFDLCLFGFVGFLFLLGSGKSFFWCLGKVVLRDRSMFWLSELTYWHVSCLIVVLSGSLLWSCLGRKSCLLCFFLSVASVLSRIVCLLCLMLSMAGYNRQYGYS